MLVICSGGEGNGKKAYSKAKSHKTVYASYLVNIQTAKDFGIDQDLS